MQETVQEATRQDSVPEDMQANERHVQENVQRVSQVPIAATAAGPEPSATIAATIAATTIALAGPLTAAVLAAAAVAVAAAAISVAVAALSTGLAAWRLHGLLRLQLPLLGGYPGGYTL